MYLENAKTQEAAGAILVHNIPDARGHKLYSKGHQLSAEDVEKLCALGKMEVYVARLEPDDVRENQAVERIARALSGENVDLTPPASGRVNALAGVRGVFQLNADLLARVNALVGVTVATIAAHRVVEPKQLIATYKTIGLALPERVLHRVEALAQESGAVLSVRALRAAQVAVILTGSPETRGRVEQAFQEPIQSRIQELGGQVITFEYVPENSTAIAEAITRVETRGADCIILAGETSIMDAEDITPRGIQAAGGTLELFGAPVEPGNLLLLAYHGQVPIVGAPGCVKSRDTNVIDLILPRLLSGERVSRADVIALANGGLLL